MATTFSHGQISLNATMLKVIWFRIEIGFYRISNTETPSLDFIEIFACGLGYKLVELFLCHRVSFFEMMEVTPPRSGAAIEITAPHSGRHQWAMGSQWVSSQRTSDANASRRDR